MGCPVGLDYTRGMPDVPDRLETLRCADQDREMVAQLLNTAYADGRLTLDEHTERMSAAYDARTFGELNRLTTDLVPPPQRPLAAAAPRNHDVVTGAYTGGNALLSTLRPGAIGALADNVTINAWLGEVRLDLVGAAFASRSTTLNLGGLMCDVKIRVPEGVTVDTSGLTLMLSDSKINGTVPHPDGVVIRLVGTLVMGEVKVLGPQSNPRKYQKFVS